VTDLGFEKQAKASNTTDHGSETLHPREARLNRSASDASSVQPGDETTEISAQERLAKRLRASYCMSKASDSKTHFIPISEIERVLSREAVQEVLEQKIHGLSGDESTAKLEKLTQDICGVPSRRRIFALLLLGDRAECIQCFVNCSIDDTHLPFFATSDLTEVHPRGDARRENRLECFEAWKPSEVEWLLTWQHAVASPFFDLSPGTLFLYILPEDTILPFVESEVAGQGGYANVWKVLIHPAHHNFRSSPVRDPKGTRTLSM